MSSELRFRQIHMDFHTSGLIEGIGAAFDPDEFADTLARAHVDSVTCFARCHHGYIYYDSQRFPDRRHPHMARPLLEEQIAACHKRGIRVPIYVTVEWDYLTAEEHPEWLSVSPDGRIAGTPPFEPGFYRRLCLNTPYVEFLKEHVCEILETLPTDGLFFDIVMPQDCACNTCRRRMRALGLDPADADARKAYGLEVVNGFCRDMTSFVRRINSDCTVFYNSGHVGPRHRDVAGAFTHFELESLPSGGWGYLHFPSAMRYARTLGRECLGMTGKFHTSWGDFHSFKNRTALEFECFQMTALGAKCSVGDQLHPSGRICAATYDLVGQVYASVEQKEPWLRGARPMSDVAVVTPEETTGEQTPSVFGATRLLQEGAVQFDFIDSHANLSPYRVVVLPDEVAVSKAFATRLSAYVADGGAILASYRSGLNADGTRCLLPELGIAPEGEAPFNPDFIIPDRVIGRGLPETEHVMYLRGMKVAAAGETEVLAEVAAPYFNRTHEHFCSHRHAPSSGTRVYPGVTRNGRVIYFSHPVFRQYHACAPLWCKRMVLNALDLLNPEPLVRLKAPSSALCAVNEQLGESRLVFHVLHYIPERRGTEFDIIEDSIPIHGVEVAVRVARAVRAVRCVPGNADLPYEQEDGYVRFTIPSVDGHAMVCIELG